MLDSVQLHQITDARHNKVSLYSIQVKKENEKTVTAQRKGKEKDVLDQ